MIQYHKNLHQDVFQTKWRKKKRIFIFYIELTQHNVNRRWVQPKSPWQHLIGLNNTRGEYPQIQTHNIIQWKKENIHNCEKTATQVDSIKIIWIIKRCVKTLRKAPASVVN